MWEFNHSFHLWATEWPEAGRQVIRLRTSAFPAALFPSSLACSGHVAADIWSLQKHFPGHRSIYGSSSLNFIRVKTQWLSFLSKPTVALLRDWHVCACAPSSVTVALAFNTKMYWKVSCQIHCWGISYSLFCFHKSKRERKAWAVFCPCKWQSCCFQLMTPFFLGNHCVREAGTITPVRFLPCCSFLEIACGRDFNTFSVLRIFPRLFKSPIREHGCLYLHLPYCTLCSLPNFSASG